jgi:hypothetical protein
MGTSPANLAKNRREHTKTQKQTNHGLSDLFLRDLWPGWRWSRMGLAWRLQRLGVRRGDRVACISPNVLRGGRSAIGQ